MIVRLVSTGPLESFRTLVLALFSLFIVTEEIFTDTGLVYCLILGGIFYSF